MTRMKRLSKRFIACAAAFACAGCLSGCADTGYVMSVDDIEFKNGIYLNCLLTSISNANTEVKEEKEEYGETGEVDDIFKETVDGKDAELWIKEDALNQMKRYAAVQRLCEENGLSISEEKKTEINETINSLWNEENFYAQYIYGTDTMGEYYDSIGISKDSMRQIYTYTALSELLFEKYYDTDGITPVSNEEFNSYIKENYASVKYVELEFDDYQGLNLKEEADIQAVRDKAQSYADRLNGGESFIEIKYEFDLKTAQDKARVDAEDSYGEETAEEKPDYDAYIEEKVNAVTVEKAESEDKLDTVINKENSTLDEDITEYIWNLADDSKASLFETSDSVYVVVRDDITAKDTWKSDNRLTVLKAIKNDEYENILKEKYAGYQVQQNSYLVDSKYAPDKIKGADKL